MKRDLYKSLGIEHTATSEEVRAAYFLLAQRYHPDLNPGQSVEQSFKEIQSAYEVLSNPESRLLYDHSPDQLNEHNVVQTPPNASNFHPPEDAKYDPSFKTTVLHSSNERMKWLALVSLLVTAACIYAIGDGARRGFNSWERSKGRAFTAHVQSRHYSSGQRRISASHITKPDMPQSANSSWGNSDSDTNDSDGLKTLDESHPKDRVEPLDWDIDNSTDSTGTLWNDDSVGYDPSFDFGPLTFERMPDIEMTETPNASTNWNLGKSDDQTWTLQGLENNMTIGEGSTLHRRRQGLPLSPQPRARVTTNNPFAQYDESLNQAHAQSFAAGRAMSRKKPFSKQQSAPLMASPDPDAYRGTGFANSLSYAEENSDWSGATNDYGIESQPGIPSPSNLGGSRAGYVASPYSGTQNFSNAQPYHVQPYHPHSYSSTPQGSNANYGTNSLRTPQPYGNAPTRTPTSNPYPW